MQISKSPIFQMALIISKQHLDINAILDLIIILNNSTEICRDIITILEDVFKHEKSNKILVAVNVKCFAKQMQALQYMVKNCNRRFHAAANRQSFQKRLLSLLNRLRGKTNILKQINSNTDNWCRIEAKVLYIIQLWYDAFILQQNVYPFIINTYKILRKENITFPPRSKNEKNLMAVSTQSPIFDNLQQIAEQDQKKFNKKLNALGLNHLQTKMQKNIETIQSKQKVEKKILTINQVNIDEISEKIAIIQSTESCTRETMKIIEQIKKAIEFGVVKKNQEKYWGEVKSAAEKLVQDWEANNAQFVNQEERKYLEKKHGLIGSNISDNSNKKSQQNSQPKIQTQGMDLLDNLQSIQYHPQQKKASKQYPVTNNPAKQIDLLDL